MNIVFHDVDGCLNADANTPIPLGGEQLPSHQTAKLQELGRKLDHSSIDHFVINTGRSMEQTLSIVDGIASQKLRYVIAEHGAIYRDVKKDLDIEPQGLIADRLELIRNLIDWYQNIGANILNERVGEAVPVLDKVANLTLDVRDGLDSQLVFDVFKAIVRSDAPLDYNQLVFHHSTADGFIDAMSQTNKGDGIDIVTSLLSDAHDSTKAINSIAIGNGLNDLPMLEVATIPVCPANAEPEVREYCRSRSGVVSEYEFIDATLEWLEA